MDYSNKINRNTIYNMLKSVFSIIYPLITFPYISRVLMAENVGKISFGSSFISYTSLIASLGVTTYAVRECSKVRNDKEMLGKVSSEILSINVVSTIVAYLGLALLLVFAKPLESYRLLICIQSTTILFATIGADWLNTAMEDFRFIAIRTISMQIIAIALMIMFVHRPEHYIRYAVISVIASSGANIVNVVYRRKFCRTRFTVNMNIRKHLPKIMMMFSLTLSQTIYVNSDMTILGLIKGDFQVGLYSMSVKMYTIVNAMIASIAMVVMPQLSENFSKGNYDEINKLLKYGLNFIIILGIPCFCGIEIIAPQMIRFFAGEEFIEGALSLRILGVSMLFSLFGGWLGNMGMIPAGREKICLRSCIASAAVNIVLNLILIPTWGLNAAAFTTAVSELTAISILYPNMDEKIEISGLKEMFRGPLIGGLGIIIIGLISQVVLPTAWSITIATIAISILWYSLVLYLVRDRLFEDFMRPFLVKIKRRNKN